MEKRGVVEEERALPPPDEKRAEDKPACGQDAASKAAEAAQETKKK